MRKLRKKYSAKRQVVKKKTMKSLVSVTRQPHEHWDSNRKYGDFDYINKIKR
tara:strand:- start:693 stop:848 length:156 start_codon:yes stop_codon:yes gene_type:complete